jgi:uncharacterized protein YjbI with pentapeptide repeats
MANEEHLTILRQGVEAWNAWREAHPTIRPDLSEATLNEMALIGANLGEADLSRATLIVANLSGATLSEATLIGASLHWTDLSEADLSEADLSSADLSGADLRGALLRGANLRWADLCGANLRGANLRRANLSGTDLSGAYLIEADLSGAHLSGAHLIEAYLQATDFSRVILGKTVFAGIDFSTVIGLDTVEHEAPSTIGIDTWCLSQGQICTTFLSGCGLPAAVIANLPLLLGATQAVGAPPAPDPAQTATPQTGNQSTPAHYRGAVNASGAESSLLNEEEIAQQRELLTAHRRRLANQLRRLALLGAAHAPSDLTLDISDARVNIARVKVILRASGVSVNDHPDDTDM